MGDDGDTKRQAAMAPAAAMTMCRAVTIALALLAASPAARAGAEIAACATAGTWIDPSSGSTVTVDRVVAAAAKRSVVLLGEVHDDADHHRWQLFMLAALHAQRPNMVIGLEMLPRRAQPVLDAWVADALTPAEFVEQSEWTQVWGFDAEIYLPILHFARLYRVALVALNVERSLVAKVGEVGWAGVPGTEREGVSDPAPAADGYVDMLARVYAAKRVLASAAAAPEEAVESVDLSAIRAEPAFARFAEAQLTWDRAMAQAIAAAHGGAGAPLVVGLVGIGHAEHRYGIARQLADLGIGETAILLPTAQACDHLDPGLADAVFVTGDGEKAAAKPRLGVVIETAASGVSVREVAPNSVAETAGIEAGDVIAMAAGVDVHTTADLIAIVRRQAPGTWLPIVVRRDGAAVELVAKFPVAFE